MLLKNSITEDKTIWAGLNHPELPLEEADIAVFGIPYDGGVSFRSGTCEAPQELRKITHTISPTTEDFRDISSVKVKDLGDCVGKDRDEMFAEAEELAYQAVKAGKFFIHVHTTGIEIVIVDPDRFQSKVTLQNLICMRTKQSEQFRFFGSQFSLFAF